MIFCIFGGGKCRPRWGVQRGLPLALLGNFQRYDSIAARTNSLISYGIFPVNTLRRAVRLPFGGGCPCRLLPCNPHLIFSLPVGGGAVVSVFKGSFVRGGRIQGFPDKYARSEARGRFIGKRRSRPTF
ncbi:hypothetical protein [Phocaeicola vulgatus]|uniref:hypothetical protein n=1 Tax=Phocaeicola vulgatus TaxID=821 RepID=UPI003DA262A3